MLLGTWPLKRPRKSKSSFDVLQRKKKEASFFFRRTRALRRAGSILFGGKEGTDSENSEIFKRSGSQLDSQSQSRSEGRTSPVACARKMWEKLGGRKKARNVRSGGKAKGKKMAKYHAMTWNFRDWSLQYEGLKSGGGGSKGEERRKTGKKGADWLRYSIQGLPRERGESGIKN
eukprot:852984-Amorphochlora_amoeboformis.AAC.1